MTKIRYCDKCKKTIITNYIKCSLQSYENKILTQSHEGDLCLECWRDIVGENK